MEVVVAAAAEEGQVVAGFEAALAVTALGAGGALETSGILFLELVGGGEDTLAFLFFLNHQFVIWCLITVHGRLSTTSSLQFWPQETKTPLIGIETQLESIEFKEKSK